MLTVIRSEGRFKIPAVRRSSHNTNPTIAESAHGGGKATAGFYGTIREVRDLLRHGAVPHVAASRC